MPPVFFHFAFMVFEKLLSFLPVWHRYHSIKAGVLDGMALQSYILHAQSRRRKRFGIVSGRRVRAIISPCQCLGKERVRMSDRILGVIFDLDGVIVSTDNCHYLAWKRMADEEGIYFDRTINELPARGQPHGKPRNHPGARPTALYRR